jgi:hypothetical protein
MELEPITEAPKTCPKIDKQNNLKENAIVESNNIFIRELENFQIINNDRNTTEDKDEERKNKVLALLNLEHHRLNKETKYENCAKNIAKFSS